MTAQINLLPTDQSGNKKVDKTVVLVNKLALAATAVFLIITLAGGAAYFFLSQSLNRAKVEREDLVTNIQNLQGTEASLILVKDRLQKSQAMLLSRVNETAFAKQRNVFENNPDEVAFAGSQIDAGKSTLEVDVANSLSLSTLVTTLLTRSDLTSLIIDELSFDQVTGFNMQMEIF